MGQQAFWGFRRRNGRAGVRNRVVVLSIVGLTASAARRVAAALPGSLFVSAEVGRGQLGEDAALYRRQLIGLGCNPNAGAVLVIGADRKSVDAVAAGVRDGGAAVAAGGLGGGGGEAVALTPQGIRAGAPPAPGKLRPRRPPLPLA